MTPLPLHLGPLHGIEWLLLLLLTFGPVLALIATVVVVRRRDHLEDPATTAPTPQRTPERTP